MDENQLNLFSEAADIQRKINEVINMGIQESIVLAEIIENGSTTVHDLTPKINCPYSVIRDLQKTFGIKLDFIIEKRMKRAYRKGKVCDITVPYKRYFLAKLA